MFGIAETSGRLERRTARRLSFWARDYLREVALADFCCAVVGPRTTIRPTAGLTRLHSQLAGFRLVLNGLFDRRAAGATLIMLAR